MSPAQQRVLTRMADEVCAAMIAEALARVAFSRSSDVGLRAALSTWTTLAHERALAQQRLERALRAVESGDLTAQLEASVETARTT